MRADILKKAGIDYDFGVKRFVGRAQLYEKVLTKFSKDATYSRVRAAREADDKDALLATAHEFKGMCGNIGLTALYERADAIVRMLRGAEYTPEELAAACDRLDTEYATAHDAVVASMEDTK